MKLTRTVFTAGVALMAGVSVASAKVDFAKDIQPILTKSCVECHNADKTKGDLRLDNKEGAMHDIKAGKSGDSEVFKRISLPKDHDDIMPPKGDPLPKEQQALIKQWIDEGAVWPDGLVLKVESAGPAKDDVLPDVKPTPGELKAFAKLDEMGLPVRQVAMNSEWRTASWHLNKDKVNGAALALLKGSTAVLELNLAGTKVMDADLANLGGLTCLRRLHLENTAITDAGLAQLKGLTNLRYLNLYNTKITDAGLAALKGLKHLKHVYVFETKVTEAGAKKLQEALPEVTVNTGAELKVLAQVAEDQKQKEEAEKKTKAAKKKDKKK